MEMLFPTVSHSHLHCQEHQACQHRATAPACAGGNVCPSDPHSARKQWQPHGNATGPGSALLKTLQGAHEALCTLWRISAHLLPHPLLKMNSSPAETLGPPNIQLCPGISHSFPCPENAQDPQSREMLASMQLCPGGCWGLGVPAFWLFSPLSPKHAGRVECAEWDPQLGAAGTCWAHPEAGWEWERVPPTPRWPHYPF